MFARVAFNNSNKKILPILLRGFNNNVKNKKYTYRVFKERVIKKTFKIICRYGLLVHRLYQYTR